MNTTKLIVGLAKLGIDTKSALARFMNDDELYCRCLAALVNDNAFDTLYTALQGGDYSLAFTSAHTIKGISGNLGITPMYKTVCEMVELLRHNEYGGIMRMYQDVHEVLFNLKKLIENAD